MRLDTLSPPGSRKRKCVWEDHINTSITHPNTQTEEAHVGIRLSTDTIVQDPLESIPTGKEWYNLVGTAREEYFNNFRQSCDTEDASNTSSGVLPSCSASIDSSKDSSPGSIGGNRIYCEALQEGGPLVQKPTQITCQKATQAVIPCRGHSLVTRRNRLTSSRKRNGIGGLSRVSCRRR